MFNSTRFQYSPSVLGWILYDVASSGYILMIPGVAYAVYFRQVVCGANPGCDALWGLLIALSLGLAGMLSPLVGAIADLGSLRHRLFVAATLLCCTATAGLFWVKPGDVLMGGVFFVAAQVGYLVAAGLYDAYLPELVDAAHLGRLSGLGWGLGYVGGIACFLMTMPLVQAGFDDAHLGQFRLTFVVVAGFYLAIALPAFLWLPRQTSQVPSRSQTITLIHQAYRRVFNTLNQWRQQANTFQFLGGYYLISDAIVTLNTFIAIYFSAIFGLSVNQILQLSLLFNTISIVSTIGFGSLSDRFSHHRLLQVILGVWVCLIVMMTFSTDPRTPILVAIFTGLIFGPTQSFCRSWFAGLISENQAGEMFGFHALVSRVSAIFGPLMFGFISSVTGNQRLAVLSLLLFIIGGGIVLLRVQRSRSVKQ